MSDTTQTTDTSASVGIGHNRPPKDEPKLNAEVIIRAILENSKEETFHQAQLTCYLWQHRTKYDRAWCEEAFNASGKARTAFLDLTLKDLSSSFRAIAPKEKIKGEKREAGSKQQTVANQNRQKDIQAARLMLTRAIAGYTFFCLNKATWMHVNPDGSLRYTLADMGKGVTDDQMSASNAVRVGNDAAKKLWDKETPTRVKTDREKALGNAIKSMDHHLDAIVVSDGKLTTTVDNKVIALDPQLSADVQSLFAKMTVNLFTLKVSSAKVIDFILEHVPGVTVDGKPGKIKPVLSAQEAEKLVKKPDTKTASNGVTVAKSATDKVVAFVKGKKPAKK